jgi:DMSO/TMAO reductase YedYZ molybdopterin-dependent catalytic subunit
MIRCAPPAPAYRAARDARRVDGYEGLPDLDAEILIAYEMNGEPLDVDHGAPFRLIVPHWHEDRAELHRAGEWTSARLEVRRSPYEWQGWVLRVGGDDAGAVHVAGRRHRRRRETSSPT